MNTNFEKSKHNYVKLLLLSAFCLLTILLPVISATYPHPPTATLLAVNDYVNAGSNRSITILALSNDQLGDCNITNITVNKLQGPFVPGATVTISSGKNFIYKPATDFVGKDSIQYQITCSGNTSNAWIYIDVKAFPDNIEFVDCYGTPPAFEWSIKEAFRSAEDSVSTYSSPMVGDLNGDGIPEIMAGKFGEDRGDGVYRYNNGIYVFWGNDRTNPTLINTKNYLFTGYGFSAARVKIGGEYKPMMVIAASFEEGTTENGYLFAYTPDPTKKTEAASRIWRSDVPITDYFRSSAYTISFADFDGDGNVEICAGGCIFDAATGKLLTQVPAGGNLGKSKISTAGGNSYSLAPVIADVNEDGKLEYVAGTEVYSVNITNRMGTAGNNMTLISSIASVSVGSYSIKDGATVVADINRDGHLDVVVRTNLLKADAGQPNFYGIMVWDPRTQQLIAKTDPIACTHNQSGMPFIGNIDNEPNLEILLTAVEGNFGRIDGFRWDGTTTLKRVYKAMTTDQSGETGITLFDFNQDGIMELVYRDQTDLRIMHAESAVSPAVGTLTNLATFEAGSATGFEYPVIADVDNDGHAEIVTTGGDPNSALRGTLRIYKSGCSTLWAPARPVWNQYMYNVVNVNKDLTIPKIPFNPAYAFAGNCGGTAFNPHHPFNAFLQQQTALNQEGCPLWLLPKIEWVNEPTFSNVVGDSVMFSGTIKNTGNSGLIAPIYITTYKNSVSAGNVIKLDSILMNLNANEQFTFNFAIKNVSSLAGVSKLIFNVNDKQSGTAIPYQTQCNVMASKEMNLVLAINDQVSTAVNRPVTIYELNNDLLGECIQANIGVTKLQGPFVSGATAALSGKNFTYTPANGFEGIDSIQYQINCNGTTSNAWIYINVFNFPDNIEFVDCYGTPPAFEWSIKEAFRSQQDSVSTYISPVVGDLDGDGIPEILVAKFLKDQTPNRLFSGIYVYWGNNRSQPTLINTVDGFFPGMGFSIARVKIGGVYKPVIVMIGYDRYLYAYSPDPSKTTEAASRIWKSTDPAHTGGSTRVVSVSFTDFDSDGEVEVYAAGKIYNAATGQLLVEVPAGGNTGLAKVLDHMPIAADVNNDGKPEYIAGTEVYAVHITNRNGTVGNSMTLTASIPQVDIGNGITIKDGFTSVADINLDGRLDVIVRDGSPYGTPRESCYYGIIAWDVQTQSLIAKTPPIKAEHYQFGVTFIGNVDDDPNVEILLTAVESASGKKGRIDGFRWDGNQTLNRVYTAETSDESGETGITLFDFNQDGKMELIYRDQTDLRIMHAVPAVWPAVGTFTNLSTFIAGSGTGYEYPVVADVDNDGHAEIVTTGGDPNTGVKGTLRIYKSGSSTQWAPARPVWNQYAYNVVNVNKDLTIPKTQFNPAYAFAGNCGGTATNPHRPYNAFLQQQTILNQEGCPLWLLPKLEWVGEPTLSAVEGDSVVFTGTVTNTGEAGLIAPIYITAYKNSVAIANIVKMDSIQTTLGKGETITFHFVIKNISSITNINKLIFNVNDRKSGTSEPYQPQCNVMIQKILSLIGVNDDYGISNGSPVKVPVLKNDNLGPGFNPVSSIYEILLPGINGSYPNSSLCPSCIFSNGIKPAHGTISVDPIDHSKVIYTPDPGFTGRDTFTYIILMPDGEGEYVYDEATVIIDVFRANDDTAATDYKKPVNIEVLKNDSLIKDPNNPSIPDPSNPPKVIIHGDPTEDPGNLLDEPDHGTITLKPNGTITYEPKKPNAGETPWSGIDEFEYEIQYPDPNNPGEIVRDKAKVYVLVIDEDQLTCNDIKTIHLDVPSEATLSWYTTETGGVAVGTGDLSVNRNDAVHYVTHWLSAVYTPEGVENVFPGRHKVRVRFVPKLMYWSKNAEDNDWNNPSNWTNEYEEAFDKTLELIPWPCTTVHIPGEADKFPSLNAPITNRVLENGRADKEPTCDKIYYHFGSEVAKPHYLKYNKAYVQYNFGQQNTANSNSYHSGDFIEKEGTSHHYSAQMMERNRYYALSAPLKQIVTGDFSIGGYPKAWQQGFKSSRKTETGDTGLSGDWYLPNNSMSLEIGPLMNYAISLKVEKFGGEPGQSDHKNLNGLNGIFELPYFENPGENVEPTNTSSTFHRLHWYEEYAPNAGYGTSYFAYYFETSLNLAPTSKYKDSYQRNQKAYRFVFEDNNNSPIANFPIRIPVDASKNPVMIGNPFISSFDFSKLLFSNTGKIEPTFYLYVNGSYETPTELEFGPDYQIIAPLQAFFVTPRIAGTIDEGNGRMATELLFTENMSVNRRVGTQHQLRSASTSNNDVLTIRATNTAGSSRALLVLTNPNGNNNVTRLFSNDIPALPQVYVMEDGEKNEIQYLSGKYPVSVPLGIRSNANGSFELRFENIGNLPVQSVILMDKETQKEVELTENNIYNFTNTSGNLNDRFILIIGREKEVIPPVETGIDNLNNAIVNIYVDQHTLHVNAGKEISEVQIASVTGVRMMTESVQNEYQFRKELNFAPGVYIVTVKLKGGSITNEKIIIK